MDGLELLEPADSPVKGLWGNRSKVVLRLCPGSPRSIFKPDPITVDILASDHIAPRCPNILFLPVMGKIVNMS